ncbi:MAG: ParB/RepB/Spo0J family partition protein [Moorea sp. SIO4G2]|uniref:ParB/RepB/Spo0J family partition protein n=1 Tax=Moorena sp. SIO3I6 TaxID=2607831 RepID=UPI0013F77914|nr:ParB/RepB/Spo0J family partition protein [Moorena sp. SIO3I6]NEO63998.1 ParB/RepB/Spo0J family partition protein [Moorena sp. SIO4G2]NEP24974.1 ParB/RepB/Spo0J family partition protein [Moorena sp. SIO3I6]
MATQCKSLSESVPELFERQLTTAATKVPAAAVVPLELIYLPRQKHRRYFDPHQLDALIHSVQEQGILEPLLVRPIGSNHYELVAGERRLKAAIAVGLKEVPVRIRELSESEALELALVENLQREDLNPVEETEGILQLIALEQGLTQDEVVSGLYRMYNQLKGNVNSVNPNVRVRDFEGYVQTVFKSLGRMSWESFVKNRLPLLKLPGDILEALRVGQIEYTKALALAKVKDQASRQGLLAEAIAKSLSLSQIRKRVKALQSPPGPGRFVDRIDATYKRLKKSKVWEDLKKREKLESLLAQIEELISLE